MLSSYCILNYYYLTIQIDQFERRNFALELVQRVVLVVGGEDDALGRLDVQDELGQVARGLQRCAVSLHVFDRIGTNYTQIFYLFFARNKIFNI